MFRAYEPGRERLVAVKVFRLELTPEQSAALVRRLETLVARFNADGAVAAHPAVAAPIAAGLDGHAAYLAMEYAVGDSLDMTASGGPMRLAEVVPIIDAIAGALDRSAERGVRHELLHLRDIIMSADGPRVTGLGVAEALSSIGMSLPVRRPYAAQEGPSDVYSLAAIACELISGRRMTPGGWDELSAEDGPELRDAFAAALSEDRHLRPSRAGEFAARLREAAGRADLADLKVGTTGHHRDGADRGGRADLQVSPTGIVDPEFDTTNLDRFADLGAASDLQMDFAEAPGPIEPIPATTPVPPWTAQPPKLFQVGAPEPSRRRGLKFTAAFLVIVALGFAAGYALRSRATRQSLATPPASTKPPVEATTVDLPAPVAPESTLPAPTPSRPASGVAPPPLRTPVRPQAEPGRLLIRSTPADATVSINGQSRGKTPLAVRDLPLGSYTIHLARDGFVAEVRRLRLTAKRPSASLAVELRETRSGPAAVAPSVQGESAGSISVDSRPVGARVFVNDRFVGATPLAMPDLPAGPATVRIEMDGYQTWATRVRVAAGERTVVTASLDRK